MLSQCLQMLLRTFDSQVTYILPPRSSNLGHHIKYVPSRNQILRHVQKSDQRALRSSKSDLTSICTGSQADTGMLFQMHQSSDEKSNANKRRSIHETMIGYVAWDSMNSWKLMTSIAKNGQEAVKNHVIDHNMGTPWKTIGTTTHMIMELL
ncbi:hypothetical protein ACHAPF_002435 [Botrytis cinerea]